MAGNNPFATAKPTSPPPVSPGSTTGGRPPGAFGGGGVKPPQQRPATRKLSILPTIVAVVLILVSSLLAFFVLTGLNSDAPLPWAILGYVLTPFGTAGCLIWARALDLRNQSDPGYLKMDGQRRLKVLGFLALVSFIPALAFIWYLASYVGSVIA